MRRIYLSCVLLLLLAVCFQLRAQQPSATSPQQPSATRPDQTPPTAEPTPPVDGSRRVERPPAGFDQPQENARPLTIDEAITLSLKQASVYQQAQFDERLAAEDVKQSRAGFFPQFSVPLTYFGTTPSRYRLEDEPLIYSYVSSSAIHETTALLQATGELDLSGRLRAQLSRSRYLLEAARAGTLIARRALALNTVDAYYALMLARQRRRLAEETLSLAEGFLKVVEGQMQRGEDESEGTDILRARTQVATHRDELEQARAGEAAAMDVLRVLTGTNFSTALDVSRISQDLPTASDFMSYTEEVLKSRPELAQIDAQKRAAQAEASTARRERLPQLGYTVNGGFDAGDFRPLSKYAGGSATVTLTIPIFDFGGSKSRETQARLRAQALDMQREMTVRLLQQEFYTARAAALSALTRIRETETGANEAQRNLMLVFARYRAKKATITDVVDAQAAYAEARLAYFQAIVDYRTARFRLEQNLGQ
ncbi:MAG: TolC family protein [Acidobacteria bacterium]|nr:TolC family protein [Acidobacteriota bacterium]